TNVNSPGFTAGTGDPSPTIENVKCTINYNSSSSHSTRSISYHQGKFRQFPHVGPDFSTFSAAKENRGGEY
nr:hypothetical protein [Oscillospiraceae bacterium]